MNKLHDFTGMHYPSGNFCYNDFFCKTHARLYSQLSNLWRIPNWVTALLLNQAHQNDSNDTSEPKWKFQIGFPISWFILTLSKGKMNWHSHRGCGKDKLEENKNSLACLWLWFIYLHPLDEPVCIAAPKPILHCWLSLALMIDGRVVIAAKFTHPPFPNFAYWSTLP